MIWKDIQKKKPKVMSKKKSYSIKVNTEILYYPYPKSEKATDLFSIEIQNYRRKGVKII